ncbi:MAG: hypothetical protein ACSHX3_15925 [Litorimonas sp.]
MKQIPMLFSAAMIEALLAGTKTETRRIFKDAPHGASEFNRFADGFWRCQDRTGRIHQQHFGHRTQTGDLIWVREAHYAYGHWETTDELTKKTGKSKRRFVREFANPVQFEKPHWAELSDPKIDGIPGWYKRLGRFMHKRDSRMTLRVTGYNIERLHDIDVTGAIAEGCRPFFDAEDTHHAPCPNGSTMEMMPHKGPIEAYQKLWNSINGTDAWDKNPWVDVTKFEVIHRNVLRVL